MNSIEFHCYHFEVMTPNKKEVKAKYKKSICINWFPNIASFKREFLFQK